MSSLLKAKDEDIFQVLKNDGIVVTEQVNQSARCSYKKTLYNAGDDYYNKRNYETAFTWFHLAALRNYGDAQAQIGYMYRFGLGQSLDYKKAMEWSMKAASIGNANGQCEVGFLYYHGNDVYRSYTDAMRWFVRAVNNGNVDAVYMVGHMYHEGKGVIGDITTAIELYSEAAIQGNKWAQYWLGYIYQYEDEFQDIQKSVNWFQKAADNNHDVAEEYVYRLNSIGFYAKEELKEIEEGYTVQDHDTINAIKNNQSQPSTTTNSNDEHFNKLMESRMDNLENMFQSKMTLIEGNNDTLQKELAVLRQKELQQDEENKQLKERLARAEAEILGNFNNDFTNDLDGDRGGDDNSNTNDVSVMEGNSYALPEELVPLKQTELEHQEESQEQKERLARMEAGIEDHDNDDLNYDSFDDGDDDDDDGDNDDDGDDNVDNNSGNNVGIKKTYDALQEELAVLKQKEHLQDQENKQLKERLARVEEGLQNNADIDLNYDSSCSESNRKDNISNDTEYYTSEEEEQEEEEEENDRNAAVITQRNHIHDNSDEEYADPNYNSSDNEDPRNDIYLD